MKYLDFNPSNRRVHHAPLRTINEMADEFGITRYQLVSDMRHSPVKAPEPALRLRGATWYQPRQLRQWRKEHLAAVGQHAQAAG
jgi:hypothetical protein